MIWLGRVGKMVAVLLFTGALVLVNRVAPTRPESVATPNELYLVVQRHLSACRTADFPLAYHAAANSVQERFTLVQFEHKLRTDYRRVAGAHHVEFGAVHFPRDNNQKALVDVYFISPRGEATGWTYALVFEDGAWKIDSAEPIPDWPSGQRLSGLKA